MKRGSLRVGTSGWHYKHWTGTFYPEGTKPGKQFEYYKKLRDWADQINHWWRQGRDVFVYFDNGQPGYAAFNAQKLKALTGLQITHPSSDP
jgi:uncharacterized protein YecE (DUF72 family)